MRLYLNKEQLEYQHHRWSEDNPVPSASGASMGASRYCIKARVDPLGPQDEEID